MKNKMIKNCMLFLLTSALFLGCSQSRIVMNDYEKGQEYEKTEKYEKALNHYKIAAENGDTDAKLKIAQFYEEGKGVEKNKVEALKWFLNAAVEDEKLSSPVMMLHMMRLVEQIDVKTLSEQDAKEIETGLSLYTIKAAKTLGSPELQFKAGEIYSKGEGVPVNYEEALKWYTKSAEQNYPPAQTAIGTMYFYGDGVSVNRVKGLELLKKAAEQNDSQAQFVLARIYCMGEGVPINIDQCVMYNNKLAEKGDILSKLLPEKMFMDCRGKKGKISESEIIKCFLIPAKLGHSGAQAYLAAQYKDLGKYKESFFWANKSAQQGDEFGQLMLGVMYYCGIGVKSNKEKANEFFQKSISQGNASQKRMMINGMTQTCY